MVGGFMEGEEGGEGGTIAGGDIITIMVDGVGTTITITAGAGGGGDGGGGGGHMDMLATAGEDIFSMIVLLCYCFLAKVGKT